MIHERDFFSFGSCIKTINMILTIGLFLMHAFSDAPRWRIIFILLVVVERIYETFYTSRESRGDQLQGDWALFAVVITYLLAFQGSFYEYYLTMRSINVYVLAGGFFLFFCSLALRWWSIFSLKNQWGIHSIESDRKNVIRKLIRVGPYQYLRHPYYLAVCIEIIAIPLIMGSHWALGFAILIVCPLEILRGYLEERNLIDLFGLDYLKYQDERAGFLPFQKKNNSGHQIIVRTQFPKSEDSP